MRYYPYWETDSWKQAYESAEAIRKKGFGARVVKSKVGYKYKVRMTKARLSR